MIRYSLSFVAIGLLDVIIIHYSASQGIIHLFITIDEIEAGT